MRIHYVFDADTAWRLLMRRILDTGDYVSPRGQPTREILHTNHVQVRLAQPLVTSPARKLNYRFAAAEALWILSGSNELAPLTRFNKRMAEFSDDGVTLFGAYGPPVVAQLPHVVDTLVRDRDTRQAVLTIWRQVPPTTKDVPCTVAMAFSIRAGQLHQHVYMRSSDAWLGVPYDLFSFACVGLRVACAYNRQASSLALPFVAPGVLTVSMTSSHLYERDFEAAERVLASPAPDACAPVPVDVVRCGAWDELEASLVALRERTPAQVAWALKEVR